MPRAATVRNRPLSVARRSSVRASMHLPAIAPGKRFTLPRPPGSADALLLARFARAARDAEAGSPRSSPPSPPTRSAWPTSCRSSRPSCAWRVFPDWETLPYDTFSPHQDLISERLATLWRMRQRRGRRGAAAGDDGADAPGAAGLPGRLHLPLQAEAAARRSGAEGAAHAGRLQPRQPGRVAGRVRGARRPDRPVPDGLAGALPRRPVRRRDRLDPHLRPRHAAQPLPGARGAAAARPRVPDGRGGAHRLPRALARDARRRPDQESRIYKDIGAGIATAGIEYYLPLFFDADGDALRLPRRRRRRWCCTARSTRRCSASGPTRASATASCSTTRERPILPPEALFLQRRGVLRRAQRARARSRCAARATTPSLGAAAARPQRRPRRAPSRWPRCSTTSTATPHRVLLVAESEGRRESLLELLRDQPHRPAQRRHAGRVRSRRRAAARSPPRRWPRGFVWLEPRRRRARSSSSPRPSSSPPRRSARRRRKQEQVSDVDALIKDLSELKVGDPVVHANHGIGRYLGLMTHRPRRRRRRRQRVPAPRVRRQGDALRAGGAAAPDQPLHRRQRRRGAAAPARLGPVGQGQAQGRRAGARHRRRAAQPVRPPRRARGLRVPLLGRTTTRPSPPASASRRRPTSTPRSTP